jgi:exonuclease III
MTGARKTIQQLIAEEEKKSEQIKARVAELKARQKAEDRKKDAHRKIVVGAAIMAHIRIDAQFRQNVRDALNKAVTEPKQRNVIPDLLSEQAFQDAMRAAAKRAAEEAAESQQAEAGPANAPAPETRPPQSVKGGPGAPGRKSA